MAKRTRKSAALPVEQRTAKFSYFLDLPGAVFIGDAIEDDEAIEYATRLQQIRSEYENDDCQEMLWHDLSQMGFNSRKFASSSPTRPRSPAAATTRPRCGESNRRLLPPSPLSKSSFPRRSLLDVLRVSLAGGVTSLVVSHPLLFRLLLLG